MAAALVCWSLYACSAAAWAKPATVVAPKTFVQSAPTEASPVIAPLFKDNRIDVSDRPKNGWREVHLYGGGVGYVSDSDLQVEGEVDWTLAHPMTASARRALPWLLRLELTAAGEGWAPFAPSTNSVGGLSLTLGRTFRERFTSELTVGSQIPDDHFGGLIVMAAERVSIVTGGPYRGSALTVAVGPLLMAGGVYDTVTFGHAEIGYEYRGFRTTFLFTAGPDLVFNDSARQTTVGCGNTFPIFGGPKEPPCVQPFNRGDVFLHVRLGFGWSLAGM
jgi:hypothetical protein